MTGIHYRPLADTVADTWRWLRNEAARPAAGAAGAAAVAGLAGASQIGLDPAKEQKILASR
jgi:hypothetical protein